MYNCRFKNCYKKNNYEDNMLETTCNNVSNNLSINDTDFCDCGFNESESLFPENPMFGQSYVPIQTLNKTFVPCIGLKMGTLFPELVLPYSPGQSIEENAFIKAMNTVKEGCNKC